MGVGLCRSKALPNVAIRRTAEVAGSDVAPLRLALLQQQPVHEYAIVSRFIEGRNSAYKALLGCCGPGRRRMRVPKSAPGGTGISELGTSRNSAVAAGSITPLYALPW